MRLVDLLSEVELPEIFELLENDHFLVWQSIAEMHGIEYETMEELEAMVEELRCSL